MNKVEFDKHMNLVVNDAVVSLEDLYCAMMRRTSTIPGIGPGGWKHRICAFSTLQTVLETAIENLEHERENSPFRPGQPRFRP